MTQKPCRAVNRRHVFSPQEEAENHPRVGGIFLGGSGSRPLRLLAPFRLSVVSTLANLTIEANQFEAIMAPAPAGAPPNVTHPSNISPTRRDGGDERCVEVRSGVVVCQKVP